MSNSDVFIASSEIVFRCARRVPNLMTVINLNNSLHSSFHAILQIKKSRLIEVA